MYYIGLDVHKRKNRLLCERQQAALEAHPLVLRVIVLAKKKNDRVDAQKTCDSLRCDFLPECCMAPAAIRDLLT